MIQTHLRVLISYHYFRTHDLDKTIPKYFSPPYPEFFLDSGAWSAFTQGATIDIDEYIAFVKRFKHWFSCYVNLDDMLNPSITRRNQKYIEDTGLSPLPVFHTGEPWHYLEDYVERYPYVCLGKIIPYTGSPKKIVPWIVKCFQIAREAGNTVYHGLGVTNWLLLKSFPWYSVDSSSWAVGFRYGRVPVFDLRRPASGFVTLNLGDFKAWKRHQKTVADLGYNWLDFADRERNTRTLNAGICTVSYIRAEQWLRSVHGKVGLPDIEDLDTDEGRRLHVDVTQSAQRIYGAAAEGLKLHLANTAWINLSDADKGLKLHLADTSFQSLQMADQNFKEHVFGEKGIVK